MPELNNVRSAGSLGALVFSRAQDGGQLFVIGATTGIPFGPYNQAIHSVTAATTLAPSTDAGVIVVCSTDGVVLTLPAITVSTGGIEYTIINTASAGGALLELKTGAATDYVVVGGTATATTNLVLANTKATQNYGDSITVSCSAGTNSTAGFFSQVWYVTSKVGTWVAQAAT